MTRDPGEELEAGGLGGPQAFSESDRVVLARNGHRGAQAEIVRVYTPGLYNLFVRLVGDRHLAADLTQEVFLRVIAALASFDLDKSFRAWIYAIAWNLARDHLRKRARRRSWLPRAARQGELASTPAPIPHPAVPERPSSWRGDDVHGDVDFVDRRGLPALDALEARERLQAVHEALDRIDPRQRALLMLKEFEDLSLEDIAALFGCGVGTVKSRLNRARLALKDALLELRPGWFGERGEAARAGGRA